MACFYCKGEMRPSTTVFTVQIENAVIVIKNVPCEECDQCGEVEISDAMMQQLERIVEKTKQLMQEVAVIDYATAA